ncbi:MAG: exodeoxyribonuclease VII large subunit [Akkermansiaceae bacterium]|nr:exodeoxyribonuclease VII large subunit [Akkermansiaceae bacterium]
MSDALSVTRLVRRMKNLLEIEIGEIWVEGEVSNLRRQASGHCYFSLKDEGAQISCVLFRGSAAKAKAQPEDGMQVRVKGEVSVYEARGQMQLIVKQVEDAGMGDLQARFEALKAKLNKEGLFDASLKKPLPSFPLAIGLVTSPTGAALQDMLNIMTRRAPWVQPILYPVTVQGKGAERSIAAAIEQFSDPEQYGLPEVDVIITGRGGGSLEDLWNFNEEIVARAIHACPIPVVSAVGHEIDFTISDFAADVRAPTPSAAIELVVPDASELQLQVKSQGDALKRAMQGRLKHDTAILQSARRALMPRDSEQALREPIQTLDRARQELKDASEGALDDILANLKELAILHAANDPKKAMERKMEALDHAKILLDRVVKNELRQQEERLQNLGSLIRTLGPESTFARGFSITMGEKGNIIRDANDVKKGELLRSRLASGELTSRAE